ncbi:hypothetical protein CARUB_v10021280mg [Capsella rubella]|uniref:Uncharacterized protein n=2 Tax=Capsella rubella TaxID=81985 RepID=R0IB14_9BRAS|nr:hypothetical protein CARUB_v10021280mg [Capsella rubella]
MKATKLGLADETFQIVTNPIISQMEPIIDLAKDVVYNLQVLRNSSPYSNFLRDLNATDEDAVYVLEKSKVPLNIMRKVVADAKERRKAREEVQERAREERTRREQFTLPSVHRH